MKEIQFEINNERSTVGVSDHPRQFNVQSLILHADEIKLITQDTEWPLQCGDIINTPSHQIHVMINNIAESHSVIETESHWPVLSHASSSHTAIPPTLTPYFAPDALDPLGFLFTSPFSRTQTPVLSHQPNFDIEKKHHYESTHHTESFTEYFLIQNDFFDVAQYLNTINGTTL